MKGVSLQHSGILDTRSMPVSRVILHAPNVHTGGGYVLLNALLLQWKNNKELVAILDARARAKYTIPEGAQVVWVEASISSRLSAEWLLSRSARPTDLVLSFSGLPPLFSVAGKVVVFLQNRNFFGLLPLSSFKFRSAVRLAIERFISRVFRRRVSQYIVQTPSMKRGLLDWYGAKNSDKALEIKIQPFIDDVALSETLIPETPKYDFVYVADGEAQKNHRSLIEAWKLLAHEGLYPSLVLTLTSRDERLRLDVESACARYSLKIQNVGEISRAEVMHLYENAKALIFPSLSESFGLPLVEARRRGLPIVASELDFVRDVCVPVQSFDPNSPVSIVRAVKRFLGKDEEPLEIESAAVFWQALLGGSS